MFDRAELLHNNSVACTSGQSSSKDVNFLKLLRTTFNSFIGYKVPLYLASPIREARDAERVFVDA